MCIPGVDNSSAPVNLGFQADGHHIMSLGHAQSWVLLGHFEAQRMWYTRASMSVSRSVRLAQMLGLYDVEAVGGSFALAPTDKWHEKEERRRTMWAIFCTDRMSSSTTAYHPLVDARKVSRLFPATVRLWIQIMSDHPTTDPNAAPSV